MKFRSLNGQDWNYGRGRSDYLRQKDALKENIRTRVLSWRRDCFFDTEAGVDWVNGLGNKGQRSNLEAQIRNVILQTPLVTGINSFFSTLDNRNLSIQYEVATEFGDITDTIRGQNA